MSALPSGTVTFVFTDIEGSTELLKQLGDRYGDVLREHRKLVRETFTAADGIEIDTQGDAFFFAFPRARDAVGAAVDVQRKHAVQEWPEERDVRVRIGLHTGEPAVGDEGYLGLDVVRAARICTAGAGGHVLLSETTRALVGSNLPDGVSVFPLGERHLKGLDEPERMYELEIEGVSQARPEPQPKAKEKPGRRRDSRPAPPGAPANDFGKRLEKRIQDTVLRMVDASFAKFAPPPAADEDVEEMAERAASFEDQIRARVDAALRAKGVPHEDA